MDRQTRQLAVAALFAVVLLGVSSCGSESVVAGDDMLTSDGPAPAVREIDRVVRWESALLEDLGHSLAIVFTGGPEGDLEVDPCVGEYEATVEETADSVTVTLHTLRLVDPPELPDDFGCNDVGYGRRLDITISGDGLAERTLIDGSNGDVRTVIDESQMLLPTVLPDGWVELRRHPDGPALVLAYGPVGADFPPLQYLATPTDAGYYNMDSDSLDWDLTEREEIDIRGNESGAYLITSLEDFARTFVFEEGGRHHRVTIQADVDDQVGYDFIESLK